jgi:hypothetical protein
MAHRAVTPLMLKDFRRRKAVPTAIGWARAFLAGLLPRERKREHTREIAPNSSAQTEREPLAPGENHSPHVAKD